jgi:hypothetical protein
LAVAGKARETLHGLAENFAKIMQVLILLSENNPRLAGGAAAWRGRRRRVI